MTNKDKYRILCKAEASIPIFSRDWWLDCVCENENWDAVIIENKNEIIASMPVYMPYANLISMPAYTLSMGIWYSPKISESNYTKELIRKQNLCEEIIRKIPKNKSFLQNFHYSFTDWLPFYRAGYEQTTRYTYLIPDISNEENVWNGFSKELKKNIEKARTKYKLTVRKGVSIDAFMLLDEQVFKRQGKTGINPEILKKLIECSRAEGRGDIWGAFDEQGQLHAAQFIVWQKDAAYCIAGGSDPAFRKSGGHSLVIWEVICFASTVSCSFDFAGSMIKGVEYFNRGFGAIQTPYFTITKGRLSFIKKLFHYSLKKIKHIIK